MYQVHATIQHNKAVIVSVYQSLTEEELEAVTVVFHQFETGLREGTIYTKVGRGFIE